MEKSSQSEKQRDDTWNMRVKNGMSADLEPMQCDVIRIRRNSQGTLTTEENTLTTKRDAFMLIGIRTTLTDSKVFQVTSHIVGLVVLFAEIPIHLLSMHQTYSLLTCTRIPCRGSHCENGHVRCCIYTSPSVAADCCQL